MFAQSPVDSVTEKSARSFSSGAAREISQDAAGKKHE
jgi:hypothetical protein